MRACFLLVALFLAMCGGLAAAARAHQAPLHLDNIVQHSREQLPIRTQFLELSDALSSALVGQATAPSKLEAYTGLPLSHRKRPPPRPAHHAKERRLSFAEQQRRRNRRNQASAARRAGKYAEHISRGKAIDFGCDASKHGRRCVCPLGLDASFSELKAEGERLKHEQRLQESRACMEQAMDLYLARVGRYYVKSGGDTTLASQPNDSRPLAPVQLDHGADADPRQTAQALLDNLNTHNPSPDWHVNRRSEAPQIARMRQLDAQASSPNGAALVNDFESYKKGQPLPMGSAEPRRHWNEHAALTGERARRIARIYDRQLREQWKNWGQHEGEKAKKPV
jgi:hypothetical protein